jgi:hypothetical protein
LPKSDESFQYYGDHEQPGYRLSVEQQQDKRQISFILCGGTLGEGSEYSIAGPVAEKMISMFRAFGVINTAFVCPIESIGHNITDVSAPEDSFRASRESSIPIALTMTMIDPYASITSLSKKSGYRSASDTHSRIVMPL